MCGVIFFELFCLFFFIILFYFCFSFSLENYEELSKVVEFLRKFSVIEFGYERGEHLAVGLPNFSLSTSIWVKILTSGHRNPSYFKLSF